MWQRIQLDGTDSGIESDVDYQIEIHDRSGNVKSYADVAEVQSSDPTHRSSEHIEDRYETS